MNNDEKNLKEQLRNKAEMKIREKKGKASTPVSWADMNKIIHELEVHQIELEMQNEELRLVRSNLESLLDQYTDLYDFAPVGYFTLDKKGVILKSNLTGAKLIGIGRSVLLNRPLGFFVLPEYRSILNNFLKTVFESQTQENCELAIMKEDTEPLVVHVEAKVLNGTSECRIAVIDITEQTLIEKKLKESEELFRSLFETMTQGVVFLDATNRIISINPAGSRILNLPMNFIQGKKWPIPEWRLIREDGSLLPHNEQPSQIVFRHNKPVEDKIIGIIAPRIKNCIWLKINAVPQYSFGEKNSYQAFLIMEDITHLKRMETYNLLTKREKEVFLLMSKNLGRQTIANMLRIKVKTVDKHKENLMKKLSIYDVDVEEIVKFAKLIGVIK